MNREQPGAISLASRGAKVQFAVGIALVSIIPLLAFGYLSSVSGDRGVPWSGQTFAVLLIMCALGFTGYTILRQYPVNIVKLRSYLEQIVRGELPHSVELVRAEDDLRAVETYLNLLLSQLRERLDKLRVEKERLQEQLYQAQKMESLGMMAAGIAHDFNNILLGILAQVELISDDVGDSPSLQNGLKDLKEFVHQAGDLIRQMLVFAGRGEFKLEPVDLGALVTDMKALAAASCRKGASILYDISQQLPAVMADPTQMRQVLMNFLINASEAIGEDRVGHLTVAVRAAIPSSEDLGDALVFGTMPPGDAVCIEVRDNGQGMRREQMERIFDPFYTTKSGRRGLGLAVALGIVMGHHGAIAVSSKVGEGSTFRVYLPVPDAVPTNG